jgi:LacI family transcriptional regulator
MESATTQNQEPRKKTTLRDIAEACGVSIRTAGYALSDPDRVAPATLKKVLQKASELQYQPNHFARGLRTGKSATLGVVITMLHDWRQVATYVGMDQAATARGYGLLMTVLASSPPGEGERGRKTIEALRQRGVEGLIIFPDAAGGNREYFLELVAEGFPVVFASNADTSLVGDFVVTDNEGAGRRAAQHFLQLGRKRVAFLTVGGLDSLAPWASARHRGLDQALAEAGLPPALVLAPLDEGQLPPWSSLGRQAIHDYMAEHGRIDFDAIFAINDATAIGAMQALEDHGVEVPGDVGIIGYDADPNTEHLRPALTTLGRPTFQIGQECVRMLLDRIDQGGSAPPWQRLLLEPILVVRESCGAGRQ